MFCWQWAQIFAALCKHSAMPGRFKAESLWVLADCLQPLDSSNHEWTVYCCFVVQRLLGGTLQFISDDHSSWIRIVMTCYNMSCHNVKISLRCPWRRCFSNTAFPGADFRGEALPVEVPGALPPVQLLVVPPFWSEAKLGLRQHFPFPFSACARNWILQGIIWISMLARTMNFTDRIKIGRPDLNHILW